MRYITNSEIDILANELNALSGSYIEKFYDLDNGRFRIKLRQNGKDINLYCSLSHTINVTSIIERSEEPTSFALSVRKRVTGFKIKRVYQLNNDRIIVFEAEKGENALNMIFEMFGKGNLIIADSSMHMLSVYNAHVSDDRSIKTNLTYSAPLQKENYQQASRTEERGFFVYVDSNEKPVDYSIGLNESLAKTNDKKEFGSLQEALAFFYKGDFKNEPEKENPKISKLSASIEKQRMLLKGFDSEIDRNKHIGETIFENMNLINHLIEYMKANPKSSKEDLNKSFYPIKVIDINLKDKVLSIEIEEKN